MASDSQADGQASASIAVSVCCSVGEGHAFELALSLPAGATALDAIRASGVLEAPLQVDLSTQRIGVWGRPCPLGAALKEGDRVEIYRPLAIDPKEARRLRAGGR